MLPKKRELSKKSVGSVSSDSRPESRSQIDNKDNTAADFLVEAPNPQVSPGSTISSIGPAKSLKNGSRNSMQERASFSDDQNTVRTLTEDAAWSVATDADGTYNLLQAPLLTDLSNVADSNAFPWPLFTTDTDWQFDFDIPFTDDPTSASGDTSSIALTELDMCQYSNRPTQGLDPAGCSRELIEYLGLGEKVSTDAAKSAKHGAFTHLVTQARSPRRRVLWVRTLFSKLKGQLLTQPMSRSAT